MDCAASPANTWSKSNATSEAIRAVAGGLRYPKLRTSGRQHIRQTVASGGLIAKLDMSPAGPFADHISGSSSLGIDRGSLGVGRAADICVFDPNEEWTLTVEEFVSEGHNSPFLDQHFHGRVKTTLVDGRVTYEE